MREEANRFGGFLLGAAAGAALMFVFDPARGRRRRAMARDKLVHAGHELTDLRESVEARTRDLRNRTRGAVAEARGRLRNQPVDDDILEARVRSKLGHVLANPGSVEVRAADGCVTLSGPVLADEADRLLATVESVPGVRDVLSRLDVRDERGSVPGLQGEADPGARR